ncbi:unnamed protein product [Ixodes pacificus]
MVLQQGCGGMLASTGPALRRTCWAVLPQARKWIIRHVQRREAPYARSPPSQAMVGDAIVAVWFSALRSLRDPHFVCLYFTHAASLLPPCFGKGTLPWFQSLQRLPTYQPLQKLCSLRKWLLGTSLH